ncbi:peptidoglycan DD-metalloendopeptidase family protein [Plantactinospora endophytica]|uniref:peptidoglycan DD-metalloendopeptidase family protein n=1 Tax=Plantactinospora endophytica TaxID=673535 RepID=UPI001EF301CB|nr:peptidoglycan DD-metalloendopeptidase family protein [Plantactinospora endophytica]
MTAATRARLRTVPWSAEAPIRTPGDPARGSLGWPRRAPGIGGRRLDSARVAADKVVSRDFRMPGGWCRPRPGDSTPGMSAGQEIHRCRRALRGCIRAAERPCLFQKEKSLSVPELARRLVRGALGVLTVAVVGLVGSTWSPTPADAAGPRPMFQLPVTCAETWRLATYVGHDDYDIDMTPQSGTAWGRPILASFGGRVAAAGIDGTLGGRTPSNPTGPMGTGGGYYVRIDHGDGWQTLYLHMIEPPMVRVGQRVSIGHQLGKVGSTGRSSGPHLHFEQQRDRVKVESWFDGVPSGITHDNAEYSVNRVSNNCGNSIDIRADRLAVGNNADGRLQAFATTGAGSVRSTWQLTPNGTFSPWRDLGGTELRAPVVGSSADGRLEMFSIGGNGRLYHKWQTTPNGDWTGWTDRGGTDLSSEISIGRNADGRLQVFVVGGDGAVYSIWQLTLNGSWSAWGNLGGTELKAVVVGSSADGRLEMFSIGGDGQLYHKWQTTPNGTWSAWASRGGTNLSSEISIGRNADGRLQVFVVGGDGAVYSIWQLTVNGSWSAWGNLGGADLHSPVAGSSLDGRMELLAIGGDGRLYHKWQTTPNGVWSAWTGRGGTGLSTDLTVGTNADGRLQAFVIGGDGDLYSIWQTTVNGSWGNWLDLG